MWSSSPKSYQRLEPDHTSTRCWGITTATFSADVTAAAALEAQITDKRNVRDTQYRALWDKVKRVRNVIKGTYGDDSSQYELVGGTRLSDRKPYKRRTTG